ncbi:hypothetical protein [Pasteurella multocida]|uniref:hypothetical protein n=1 Tax=Pasteurella multocida TaxID=747 RepID=UPI00147B6A8F|nr:hypothetical protein [Pasteurella multocida]NNH97775.1 hypothetical protein [Pasteurella multocida]NNI42882.1 hypothetical protein [Pasteurella multocida]
MLKSYKAIEYANAIIIAFEKKEPIRSIKMKAKDLKVVTSYINNYINHNTIIDTAIMATKGKEMEGGKTLEVIIK